MNDLGQLTAAFGAAAGTAIHRWAEVQDLQLDVVEEYTEGKTPARVAAVLVQPLRSGRPYKMVVKVCPPDGDGGADIVYAEAHRHAAALDYSTRFAQRHLVDMVHVPLPVDDGGWVVFQGMADRDLADPALLSRLLDRVAVGDGLRGVGVDGLAAACRAVVRLVLDWSTKSPPAASVEVPTLLGQLLGGRHRPGGSLHDWARRHHPALLDPGRRWIEIDGRRLPNPLALVDDPALSGHRKLWPILGPAHGDLHEDNVFVSLRDLQTRRRAPGFRLIDLSRFDPLTPLALDPVHLRLSMLARHLHRLPADQQAALRRYLVDPEGSAGRTLVPPWIVQLVDATRQVPPWIAGLATEWEQQTRLAYVAGGLTFAGRRTTDDALREWFLGLAAESVDAFLDQLLAPEERPAPGPEDDLVPVDRDPSVPLVVAAAPAPAGDDVADDAVDVDVAEDGAVEVPAVADERDHDDHAATDGNPGRPPWHAARASMDGDLRRVAGELARGVLKQWEAAEEARLLNPAPIVVPWRLSGLAVAGPPSDAIAEVPEAWAVPVTSSVRFPPVGLGGEVNALFLVYCQLRSGRMVVVGAPGSGKTAAAIRLVLDVLRYREWRVEQGGGDDVAVPVILTPHGWDPAGGVDLKTWITRRLVADYPDILGKRRDERHVRRLVDDGHVTLVLDGLDDLPDVARAAALRALDRQPRLRIVVISRSTEMVAAAAEAHLQSAVAVELQPVAVEEAAAYVERSLVDPPPASWARLLGRLRAEPDGPLARALDQPLMIRLAQFNYAGRAAEVAELLDARRFPTREAVEEHLLRGVVPAAYSQPDGKPPPSYRQDQVERWLRLLASWMAAEKTRDLAWWRLSTAVPRWQFRAARLLVTGVPPGVLFAVLGMDGRPEPGFAAGVGFGVAGLMFDGLVVDRERQEEKPAARITLGFMLAGIVTGLFAGVLLVGAPEGLAPGGAAGLGAALASAPLVAWLARRLGGGARPTATTGRPLDPYAYWRQDRRQSAAFGTLLALDVGAAVTAACLLAGEPFVRVAPAVLLQALVMPWFAVTLSRRAKTKIASLILWLRGAGPFRLLPFLEEARRLDLLRSAGPVYQFRHARLQDALASAAPPARVSRGAGVGRGGRRRGWRRPRR